MSRPFDMLACATLAAVLLGIAPARALAASELPAAPDGGTISCPEPFSGTGNASTYELGSFNQCVLESGDGMAVSLSAAQWEGSAHCGECLEVTGPAGIAVVRVVDQCLECPPGSLDLQPPAWLAVTGSDMPDLVPVSWTRVPCPVTGRIALRLYDSNQYFIKLQVRNHRHGIAGVTLLNEGSTVAMSRTSDNHFEASGFAPPVTSPFDVVVTSTTGESLRESVELLNNVDMPGSGQFAHCTLELFRDGFEAIP